MSTNKINWHFTSWLHNIYKHTHTLTHTNSLNSSCTQFNLCEQIVEDRNQTKNISAINFRATAAISFCIRSTSISFSSRSFIWFSYATNWKLSKWVYIHIHSFYPFQLCSKHSSKGNFPIPCNNVLLIISCFSCSGR